MRINNKNFEGIYKPTIWHLEFEDDELVFDDFTLSNDETYFLFKMYDSKFPWHFHWVISPIFDSWDENIPKNNNIRFLDNEGWIDCDWQFVDHNEIKKFIMEDKLMLEEMNNGKSIWSYLQSMKFTFEKQKKLRKWINENFITILMWIAIFISIVFNIVFLILYL